MKIILCLAAVLCTLMAMSGDAPANESVSHLSAKDLLEAYVAAWNRHDPAALDSLLSADSVHEDVPAGFRGKGPDQIKGFAGEVFKAQPDLKWRLKTIVQSGSTAAAEWIWTATYTGDGPNGPVKQKKITAHGASFIEVADGHVRRFVDYYDFASAFPAEKIGAK
jgi:steroid delta-isomerase-like uncharacterized protein